MKKLSWLLAVLLLSGCSWMKFWGDDEEEADAAAPAPLVDIDAKVEISKVWRTGIGKGDDENIATLVPALAAGHLYAATNEGRVVALDAESGDRLWQTDLDTPLGGGVGVGAGLVLVGDADGEVIALAAETGEERWRARLSSEIVSPPAANGDLVVVQALDSKLYGLAAASGAVLWRHDGETPVLSLRTLAVPTVTDSMVLAGFASGKLIALAGADGSTLWEVRVGVPKGRTELERMVDMNTPLLVDDVVYSVSFQGRVAALSRGTGRELWVQEASSHSALAFGDNQLYVVETGDVVKALRATGGQVLWTNDQMPNRKLTAPIVVNGYVAVADAEGYLHLLSAVDGQFLARIKVDGDGISVPMVASADTLYVLDNDGDVTAYHFAGK